MKLNHETPPSKNYTKKLNIRDLQNSHSNIVSRRNTMKRPDFTNPHIKNTDEIAAYNIRQSIQNMKTNLKKIYEVVRGLFGLERMPIARAEEIIYQQKFRKDETPEQRKITIEGAKKVLAKRDAQRTAENAPLSYMPPQTAQRSLERKSLKEIIAAKKAKREMQEIE